MKTSDGSADYWLFILSQVPRLGTRPLLSLMSRAGGLEALRALLSSPQTPTDKRLTWLQRQLADKKFLSDCARRWQATTDNYLSILSPDYPPLLKNIYDPPLFLYYRGRKELLRSQHLITIVGSRRLSAYHQSALRQILSELGYTPLVVVSGLALGIDGLSHRLALTNHLPTIAVLGSGVQAGEIYPAAHGPLAEKIIDEGGLLVSEYPNGTAVQTYNFPRRNRILAGLSRATLVISGAQRSGTLITAQVALEEGREVLALPGNINNALSWGPNNLIKNGAMLIGGASDILSCYHLNPKITPIHNEPNLSDPLEQRLYQQIKLELMTVEELARKLQTPLPLIQSVLTNMELKNLVRSNLYNQLEII